MPYQLKKGETVLKEWNGLPKRVVFPNGDAVHAPSVGHSHDGCTIVEFTRPEPPPRDVNSNDVNQERDKRLEFFTFKGKKFDFGAASIININGAGTLALGAIFGGSQPDDLRWASPDQDFAWIAADNTPIAMDAQTCFDFAKAAAGWKAAHIHAARKLKDGAKIPKDYTSDAYWP